MPAFRQSTLIAFVTAIFCSGVSRPASGGPIWTELGDAGETPSTAQVTIGVGPLSKIIGRIDEGFFSDDIDMFAIFIPDLSMFSATTVGSDIIDTDLFLFDSSGRGVAANGDTSLLEFETNSTISFGSLSGPSGVYFLAVASFPDRPVSTGGDIFPDLLVFASDGEVVGPNGPGGALPVSGWIGDDGGFEPLTAGAYEIQLEGASFAAVPEPTSLALLGSGLATLFGYGWRRRKCIVVSTNSNNE